MKASVFILLILIFSIKLFAQHPIKEVVRFEHDKYNLDSEALSVLDSCVDIWKNMNYAEVTIIGHTDGDGSDNYNMILSEKRARAVSEYLISQGISNNKIKIQFYGEFQPIAENDNDQHKQYNRRVEIQITRGRHESLFKADKLPQIFVISPAKDTTLVCSEGTIIKIPANSLVTKATEKQVTDSVSVFVTEYYKVSEIVLSGLSTTSDGHLLETGGMIYVKAECLGEELKLNKAQSIEITFASEEREPDMQVFSGLWEKETINWKLQSEEPGIVSIPEEWPQFPGGSFALDTYLKIAYPLKARESGIQGTVYTTFIVNENGKIINPRIIKGITPELDEAALNAIKNMKSWNPGKNKGQNVSVRFFLPIRFILEGEPYFEPRYAENFEKTYSDSTLKEAGSGRILNYVLSSADLGWINCDRFINSPNINYLAFDKEIEEVKLIFHRYKAIMELIPGNENYIYNRVPKGERITLVAVKRIDNKPYLAIKETITSSEIANELDFQPVTMDILKAEMQKLDKLYN